MTWTDLILPAAGTRILYFRQKRPAISSKEGTTIMLSFDIHNYDIYSEQDLSVSAAAVLKKREGRTIKAGGLL